MQEQLQAASSAAGWFEAFVKHGSVVSCLLSLLFGWCLSVFLRFPIHKLIEPDDWATFAAQSSCVGGSFIITFITWPNEYRLAWALAMGVASPVLGLVALWALARWAPTLHRFLAMRKVTPPAPGDPEASP
jgi:hypothetical protein